ncbi:DUF262 domain-containing HNH endonuclease family protein [Exiguobacterium acetylicum]|uniref:DUF262 domain-containing protein n=1 Tax=Exiguobacterium acetylicum TaxID=41170 RepID=UPI0027DF7E1E|nr:DUF262 domain-containing HNH endonuclease family protein [Exiguobacterium acetylicum]MDQ6468139.1 DUF262 domain-containing HNH endonuclease family protein [Exiguobacterium acetylicum]
MDGANMSDNLKVIPVANVFVNTNYSVPIYQRNYAWNELQILQLIEDIDSAILDDEDQTYFLGNLIVNQTDNNVYEVIDGQQRLTTLYLLERYLKFSFSKEALRFEARDTSNRTLAHLSADNANTLPEGLASAEILNGYHIIQNYFETNPINKEKFAKKLESVFLIRVQVPKNIDLNHYFEIMNTRGEQLELHEIAKAKLLEVLKTDQDKHVGAMIWDKCSNMNSYVQMNFDPNHRKLLFTDNWSSLQSKIESFDTIVDQIDNQKSTSQSKKSLLNILTSSKTPDTKSKELEDENERFESTISFPNFLLQVNAVLKDPNSNSSLDDKHFLQTLEWSWTSPDYAKHFLFTLLKCRVLYDKYIVKREFAKDYKETGKWSLQRLEKYRDIKRTSDKPAYVGTLTLEEQNQKLRTLQSCLRITYTSPKTMHWISLVLSELLNDESTDLIELLEQYCCEKIRESNYEKKLGFEIERIVFSYLDYLIFRDGYSYKNKQLVFPLNDDWQFQFRNSIEHFYPQHPIDGMKWDDRDLHSLGNLALITISGNSKFSNLSPLSKIDSYPNLIKQSLKLAIMQTITISSEEKWTTEKANEHQIEMTTILNKDLAKYASVSSSILQVTP